MMIKFFKDLFNKLFQSKPKTASYYKLIVCSNYPVLISPDDTWRVIKFNSRKMRSTNIKWLKKRKFSNPFIIGTRCSIPDPIKYYDSCELYYNKVVFK